MGQQASVVLGVFEQSADAIRFLDELREQGFERDDLGLAVRDGGAPITNLVQDLMLLGLPKEQADFYLQEVQAGKAVASVRTSTQKQDIEAQLQRAHAYNYQSHASDYAQPTPSESPASEGVTATNSRGEPSQTRSNKPEN